MQSTDANSTAQTVAIVGVGLIGGSLAASLKARGTVDPTVIGVGRNQQRLEQACAEGLVDQVTTDLADAAARADLIVFCTPVDLIVAEVREAAGHCRPGTLLTDAGSVKSAICTKLSGDLAESVTFIGSHPLAGSERRGFEHADARLFEGRVCVVTPDSSAPEQQVARLVRFWESVGMRVVQLTPEAHDAALAQTSHVPHLVACALAESLDERNRTLASTGFQDSTRIAAGDPDIWSPIVLQNAAQILEGLEVFSRRVDEFKRAIRDQDAAALRKLLESAKSCRESLNRRES